MYPRSIDALQAHALFASALQRSDELSLGQIRQAIAVALDVYGGAGCTGRVAQEFGDHPETAAVRMRWARAMVAEMDGQPVPRIRRMAAAESSALRWLMGWSVLNPGHQDSPEVQAPSAATF
jgi:hypothetical protein